MGKQYESLYQRSKNQDKEQKPMKSRLPQANYAPMG